MVYATTTAVLVSGCSVLLVCNVMLGVNNIYIQNNNENYYQRLRSPVAGRRYTYEPLDLDLVLGVPW